MTEALRDEPTDEFPTEHDESGSDGWSPPWLDSEGVRHLGSESDPKPDPSTTSGRTSSPASSEEESSIFEIRIDGIVVHRAPSEITSRLRYVLAGADIPSRLGVSSCTGGEGVTAVSRTFAALLAHDWKASTCWVDLNWWKPEAPVGESELFAHTMADAVNGTIAAEDLPTATSIPELSMVAAGEIRASQRSQLPRDERLWRVVDELAASFDHLVIDLPPVLETADALALSRLSDAYVLVVRQQAVSSNQVRTALQTMNTVPCLGTILNAAHSKVPRWLRWSDEAWSLEA